MRDGGRKLSDTGNLSRSRKAFLSIAQRLPYLLLIVEIDEQTVPSSHSALIVTGRVAEHLKPSVDAIGTTEPALNCVRLASGDGTGPRPRRRLYIVRVEEIGPAKALPGARSSARVVQHAPIQVVDLAVRGRAPYQSRNRLNNRA